MRARLQTSSTLLLQKSRVRGFLQTSSTLLSRARDLATEGMLVKGTLQRKGRMIHEGTLLATQTASSDMQRADKMNANAVLSKSFLN